MSEMLHVVLLQLLPYPMTVARGMNVDKPCNPAKNVTVNRDHGTRSSLFRPNKVVNMPTALRRVSTALDFGEPF